jgi:hypothetical protein
MFDAIVVGNHSYRRASLSPSHFPSICRCQVDGAIGRECKPVGQHKIADQQAHGAEIGGDAIDTGEGQVPLLATAWRSPTDPLGEFPAEFEAPLPDRLVRHRVPSIGTQGPQ